MKYTSRVGLLTALIFSFALLSCTTATAQTNETFIKGKWRVDGQLTNKDGSVGASWFQEWTFGDGIFTELGYPPLSQKGRFRVISDDENKLTLELFDQSGDLGTNTSRLVILVDRAGAALKIGQNSGFKRK